VELNLEKRQQVCDMSSELHAVKRSENQKSLFVTEVWQGLVMGFSFSHLDADQGRRNGLAVGWGLLELLELLELVGHWVGCREVEPRRGGDWAASVADMKRLMTSRCSQGGRSRYLRNARRRLSW
jgi:hypothetical protein